MKRTLGARTGARTGARMSAVSYRPSTMRIDNGLCTECGLCTMVAPEIERNPQGIPVNADTLDAMAQCPVGAIVWAEIER